MRGITRCALLLGALATANACVPPSGAYTPFRKEPDGAETSSNGESSAAPFRAIESLIRGKASLSAAAVGCDERQIEIDASEGDRWTARCADKTYHCEQADDDKVTCTRDAAEEALDAERNTDRIVAAIEASKDKGGTPQELREPPDGALGFTFGSTIEASQSACTGASHHWVLSGRAGICDGSPLSLGMPTRVRLNFCDGKLCRIIALAKPDNRSDRAYEEQFERLLRALTRKYGEPTDKAEQMPNWCRHDLLACLERKEAKREVRWSWSSSAHVRLTIQQGEHEPAIAIVYHRDSTQTALDDAL